MAIPGQKTQRYVNTLVGEGNNQLLLLDRGNIMPPLEIPNAPNDCSSDPINTICGFGAGLGITTATNSTLFGVEAGSVFATGGNNTMIGHNSGKIVFGGVGNTLVGSGTATGLRTGSQNVVIGNGSALNFTGVESRNLIIYSPAQANDSATIRIGEQGVHEAKTFIKGIHNVLQTGGSILNVTVDVNGHLGTDAGGGGGGLTGKTDADNTCVGVGAGVSITSGVDNTLIGVNAGNSITTGSNITVMGDDAYPLGNSGGNLFIGSGAGEFTTTGTNQTAVGLNALSNYIGASIGSCTAFGANALLNCNAPSNTGLGLQALSALTTATGCVAVGGLCMRNCNASQNTAVGFDGIHDLTSGVANTGIGYECGFSMDTGENNTFLGKQAGMNNVSGSRNIYIGQNKGGNHTTLEDDNIIIGAAGAALDSGVIRIGQGGTQTSTFISGIGNVSVGGTPQTVTINPATGELGSTTSTASEIGSTGLTFGGVLSINAGDAHDFDITAGNGVVYDPATGSSTPVSWSQSLGVTTAFTDVLTYVAMTDAGVLSFKDTKFTNSELRSLIFIGILVHVGGVGAIIDTINNQQLFLNNPTNSLHDLSESIGFINSGNVMSSNALLTLVKTVGSLWKFGANYVTDPTDPNVVVTPVIDTDIGGGDPDIFQYRNKDGSSSSLLLVDVIVDEFDNGGVFPSTGNVPASSWTVQRIFIFTSNRMKLQLGQFTYSTKDEAILAIPTEGFVIEPSIAENGALIGFLAVRGNATNLSTAAQAQFIPASKFGGVSGGSAAGGDVSSNISVSVVGEVCLFADTSGKLITSGQIAMDGSGTMSNIENIDASAVLIIDSSNANSAALQLLATNAAGGILIQSLTGGNEMLTSGVFDILSSANTISSMTIRATGTGATMDLTATEGVRIINGTSSGITLEDDASAFSVNLKSQSMAASYPIVLPAAQGAAGSTLINNGSGTLSWQANIGVIRDFQASDFINSTASSWEQTTLASTIPDDIFDALNVREYENGGDSGVGMKIFVPGDESSLSISISWRKDLANAGTVIWQFFAYNIPNGASIATGSWDTSQTISVNDPGSNINTVTTTVNITLANLGLTAGESCLLQIVRDVSDTFASSALLMGCTIAEGSA